MRSGYLVLLAAALQLGVTSAGPTINAVKADAWGQCGSGTGVKAQCPEGYRCDPVNDNYDQCVPNSYPPAPGKSASKRDAAVDASSNPEAAPSADLEKRQTSNTPIIGAQSASGKCYQRRKIQTLQTTYPDQFNMLLLALEDLQKQPETLDVSWFGIAGIHGAPYTVWQQPTTGTYNTRLGYCVHGSPTFATWHRPYTILMEQVLQARAVAIAAKFTGTKAAAYKTAADQLRLPYWDWSDPVTQSSLPPVVMQSTISVTRPGTNGVPVTQSIKNPLFSYTFQNPSALSNYFTGNYARWPNTTRQPRSTSDPTPNNANASTMMQNGFSVRKQQTFQLYNFKSFNGMASQLEGIHNGIHTTLGGSNPLGHMSVTNVAAFDPIFWLHHCNVDRLTVLYQAIYPSNQLQPANAVATYARIVPGTDGPQDTMSTKLYPFKMNSGSYWTSNEIKSAGTIWKYKYGYEEIPCESNGKVTAQQLSESVLARVNALYGPTTTGSLKKSRRSPEALAAAEPEAAAGPMAYAYPEPKRYPYQPGWTPKKGKRVIVRNDYTVRCMIDHSELPGSWTAHILFTGTPCGQTSSPSEYFLSRDRIAGFSSFGAPYVRKASMAYSQEFPITEDLISRGVKISDPRKTEKWLNDNLKVCFTTGDDQLYEVPAASLRTYKIGVYRQETKYPEGLKHGSTLPSYGDKKYMVGATKDMPGGIKDKKEMEYPIMLDGRIEDLEGDKDTY